MVAVATFAATAVEKVPDIGDCFHVAVVAASWRLAGMIAAVEHWHRNPVHSTAHHVTFDVLLTH